MVLAANMHFKNVGTNAQMGIRVTQMSSDWGQNTSQVEVVGLILLNANGSVSAKNIGCSIGGDASFTGPKFSFTLSQPGVEFAFINHTFTMQHGTDGNGTVTFSVSFDDTGTEYVGDSNSISVVLTLIRIPKQPGAPGTPTFANQEPRTLTVSWPAASGDGGNAVNNYELRMYKGADTSGGYSPSNGNSTTRNLTDLTPGALYTFTVLSQNDAKDNNGYSAPSASATVQMAAGVHIRIGGKWKIGVAYVRDAGKWKVAVPYVRDSGTWKLTE